MGKHLVSVDRAIPLAERPSEGHNRWHPDITPMIHVQNGDEAEIRSTFQRRDVDRWFSTPRPLGKFWYHENHPVDGGQGMAGARLETV